jgi:TolB-like protein/DNA-binding winged helix-turn-helix (wHTH) protein/Tfp pilus assembly protein PilF
MPKADKHFYEFGAFHIDTLERVLYRGNEMIPLTPKAVDTLLVLVVNRERVVDKDELLKLVWPDTFVEEGALAKNVSALRKALGGGTDEFQYIATVHKRGYRFVAQVKDLTLNKELPPPVPSPIPVDDAEDPFKWLTSKWVKGLVWTIPAVLVVWLVYTRLVNPSHPTPASGLNHYPTTRIGSLAVLPLDNPSRDEVGESFTESMHEELINTLAKIESLRVISRTSAMIYKDAHKPLPQIARELNVDAIVEGSVLQSENKVRITVELFEGKTERQLWAQDYERDLRDVLRLQGEVATDIAHEIQVKVASHEPPLNFNRLKKSRLNAQPRQVDPEAYLSCAHGRYYWNKRTPDGFRKSIEYFQHAIVKDPSYAPAYVGLADAFSLLGSTGFDVLPPNQVMPKARAAAEQAVKLDDNLAEGHTSLGYVKLSYDWDLGAAEREFEEAIRLNPGYATAHHWYVHYFLAKGQTEQALAEIHKAEVSDPFSFIISMGVGWFLYHARRYDDAIERYHTTLDLNPDLSLTYCALGMALVQKRFYREALSAFEKAKDRPGSAAFVQANIAVANALTGQLAEARRALADLQRSAQQQYVPAIYEAAIHTVMGDQEEAIRSLQKAYEERSDYMVYLKTEPSFDTLRTDRRFQDLLRRVGSRH